ncbi:uncharacterized protein CTRU02_214238 [Colletotrichum truncatum]|uniref:Uncharacterized protein n=1 Tax=Colletotrichum truncatum TaxID=5467 RepID=A0ACC3YHX3_COLTU|nr:uncharacterized protein CTRU02_11312 [Colletotrichum truncatum]KAF6786054.1 hypothetical protein CTRU02_11312 [Colletotrichum truncatum]
MRHEHDPRFPERPPYTDRHSPPSSSSSVTLKHYSFQDLLSSVLSLYLYRCGARGPATAAAEALFLRPNARVLIVPGSIVQIPNAQKAPPESSDSPISWLVRNLCEKEMSLSSSTVEELHGCR